jgi:hypothetical protein
MLEATGYSVCLLTRNSEYVSVCLCPPQFSVYRMRQEGAHPKGSNTKQPCKTRPALAERTIICKSPFYPLDEQLHIFITEDVFLIIKETAHIFPLENAIVIPYKICRYVAVVPGSDLAAAWQVSREADPLKSNVIPVSYAGLRHYFALLLSASSH